MKITRIRLFRKQPGYARGACARGRGNAIDDDSGLSGCAKSTTAKLARFAASTPVEFLVDTTDLHGYNDEYTGTPRSRMGYGRLYAADTPGLGAEPDFDSLGDPVAMYSLKEK